MESLIQRMSFIGRTMRIAPIVLLVGLLTIDCWTTRALARELPEGTATSAYPPFAGPSYGKGQAAQQDWVDAMLAFAQTEDDAQRKANALIAAAHALERRLKRPKDALPIFRQGVALLASDDPLHGPALVDIARALRELGNTEAADATLRQLEAWRMPRIRNATPVQLARAAGAQDYLNGWGRDVRISIHESFARYAQAAEITEALGGHDHRGRTWHQAAIRWARAARAVSAPRAEHMDRALRAIDRAIDLAKNTKDKSIFRVWKMSAQFDLLSDSGQSTLTDRWPGDDWYRQALAFLDELAESPTAVGYALQFGSQASASERHKEAVVFYERALLYPDVIQSTPYLHDARWFLPAATTLIKNGRFDDAERFLARIRLVFGDKAPLLDETHISLTRARHDAAAIARRHAAAQSEDATLTDPAVSNADSEPARLLVGPDHSAGVTDEEPLRDDSEPVSPSLPLLWITLGLAVLGVLVVLLRRRR